MTEDDEIQEIPKTEVESISQTTPEPARTTPGRFTDPRSIKPTTTEEPTGGSSTTQSDQTQNQSTTQTDAPVDDSVLYDPMMEVVEGHVRFIGRTPEEIENSRKDFEKRRLQKIEEAKKVPSLVYIGKGIEVPPHPKSNLSPEYVLQVIGSLEGVKELTDTGAYTLEGGSLPEGLPEKSSSTPLSK